MRQRTKTFNRKIDAERYLTSIEASKLAGAFVDPLRARTTVGAMAEQWIAGKVNLKPTTRAKYKSALKVHVLPRWATTPLSRVDFADVQVWVAQLTARNQSSALVRTVFGVLSAVLDLAVRTRRLPSNPAKGIDLPVIVHKRRRYLTADQVVELAREAAVLPENRPIRATNAPMRSTGSSCSYSPSAGCAGPSWRDCECGPSTSSAGGCLSTRS